MYLLRRRHVRSAVMFILVIVLICSACPAWIWAEAGSESQPKVFAAEVFYAGSGTAENPYIIADGEGLASLADSVWNGSSYAGIYFSLAGDIDLSNSGEANERWTPIGSRTNPFCGIFDGAGYKISNLRIDTNSMHQGLFGYLGQGAVVRNVTIKDSEILGGSFTGACTGGAGEGSLIQNVVSYANTSGGSNVGGIAGMSLGTIEKSKNYGAVSGQSSVGGIVGLGLVLKEVENTGTVSAHAHMAGGVTGELYGSVTASQNSGPVSAGSFYAGGIAGAAENALITVCFNNGNITGKYTLGGIVGNLSQSEILNCYNTGVVNGGERIGGIAGNILSTASIENVYNVGAAQGGKNTGSIAGTTAAAGSQIKIVNSYYLEGTADSSLGPGSQGIDGSIVMLTDREMKLAHERLGAAFQKDYQDRPVNGGYPILKGFDYGWKPGPVRPGGGSGNEEEPYIIDSPDDLAFLAEEPDAHYKLSGDMDLKDVDWEPVERFTGSLDGDGHEIKNLDLDSGQNDCGLFQQVDGAVIKNVTISGSSVTGKMSAGILAGSVENAVIENCMVSGSVSSGEEAVGGLVGEAYNTVIRNVTVSANVEGDHLVGGLAGYAANCEIEGIAITGQVSGRSDSTAAEIGGILGMKIGGTLEKSGVTGKVTGPGCTGGLVGVDLSGQGSWIKNCFVQGDVSGKSAGGLIGEVLTAGGAVDISNCYFAGTLTDSLGAYDNIIPEGCVSCYFDGTKNPGAAALQQKFARSTQQLQMKSTYQGWDFAAVWTIAENQSYPGLRGLKVSN